MFKMKLNGGCGPTSVTDLIYYVGKKKLTKTVEANHISSNLFNLNELFS